MSWITLALAVYGAALSSALGYLAWRKDKRSLRFFPSYHRRHDWYGLVVNVVNVGFRPVTLQDVFFEQTGGTGGYLNELDENLGLPKRLDDGEQITLPFHAADIEPDTTALVVRDTHRREYRMEFTSDVRDGLAGFRELVQETEPELYNEGENRVAPTLRRSLAATPPESESLGPAQPPPSAG